MQRYKDGPRQAPSTANATKSDSDYSIVQFSSVIVTSVANTFGAFKCSARRPSSGLQHAAGSPRIATWARGRVSQCHCTVQHPSRALHQQQSVPGALSRSISPKAGVYLPKHPSTPPPNAPHRCPHALRAPFQVAATRAARSGRGARHAVAVLACSTHQHMEPLVYRTQKPAHIVKASSNLIPVCRSQPISLMSQLACRSEPTDAAPAHMSEALLRYMSVTSVTCRSPPPTAPPARASAPAPPSARYSPRPPSARRRMGPPATGVTVSNGV